MKIWFRVGMEADVTEEEMEILSQCNNLIFKSQYIMKNIIKRAELSGETYIPEKQYLDPYYKGYDNPEYEIQLVF